MIYPLCDLRQSSRVLKELDLILQQPLCEGVGNDSQQCPVATQLGVAAELLLDLPSML